MVSELVQAKLDVLVSTEQSWVRAAKQATTTIPVVMVINGDPVAVGLVDSLSRPGGNITGVTRINRELSGKRLEILKEIIPSISLIGVLTSADPRAQGNAEKSMSPQPANRRYRCSC